MKKLYLIPGLGSDKRIYDPYLPVEGYDSEVIELIDANNETDWEEYIQLYLNRIDQDQDFSLVGISFGGIICSELSQRCSPEKVVYISTIKNSSEKPWFIRLGRYLPLHKLIPGQWLIDIHVWRFKRLRNLSKAKDRFTIMIDMAQKTKPHFISWVTNRVVKWNFKGEAGSYSHIHGTRDLLFPIRRIKNAIPVSGGSHLVVMFQRKKIKELLDKALTD